MYLKNESLGVDRARYLEICEVTNTEPEPEKIPPDYESFTYESQLAMLIVHRMPDKWDSTSGYYSGKDLTILPYLLNLYKVEDEELMLDLIFKIIEVSSKITNDKVKQQQKVKPSGSR